jgi:hypothetical protein
MAASLLVVRMRVLLKFDGNNEPANESELCGKRRRGETIRRLTCRDKINDFQKHT